MDKIKSSLFFRTISIILIFTFVVLDISYAYPPDHGSTNSTLSTPSLLQQNPLTDGAAGLRSSILSESSVVASVYDIGEYFFGRTASGEGTLPAQYADEVVKAGLGKALNASGIEILNIVPVEHLSRTVPGKLKAALDDIGFGEALPAEGVVFVLYRKGDKKFLLQIAPKGKVGVSALPGYEWAVSEKYLVKYIPQDYAAAILSPENTVAHFLAVRDKLPERADMIMAFGNEYLETVFETARLWREGRSDTIMFVGGVGHSTSSLVEAAAVYLGVTPQELGLASKDAKPAVAESVIMEKIFREVLRREGVSSEEMAKIRIVREERSTNCQNNVENARDLIESEGLKADTVILVQQPPLQRRMDRTFGKHFVKKYPGVKWYNHASFIPDARQLGDDKYLDLLVSEVEKLVSYAMPMNGYMLGTAVPDKVFRAAYDISKRLHPGRFIESGGTLEAVRLRTGENAITDVSLPIQAETGSYRGGSEITISRDDYQGVLYMKSGSATVTIGSEAIDLRAGDTISGFARLKAKFTANSEYVLFRQTDALTIKTDRTEKIAGEAAAADDVFVEKDSTRIARVYRDASGSLLATLHRSEMPMPSAMVMMTPQNAAIGVGLKTASGIEAAHRHELNGKSKVEIILAQKGSFRSVVADSEGNGANRVDVAEGELLMMYPGSSHEYAFDDTGVAVVIEDPGRAKRSSVASDKVSVELTGSVGEDRIKSLFITQESILEADRSGALSAIFPRWDVLKGMVQWGTHHDTVREHTLGIIKVLHEGGFLNGLDHPEDVLLAAFLHDFGKDPKFTALPDNHEVEGAVIAHDSLVRAGFSPEEAERFAWYVKHHSVVWRMGFEGGLQKNIKDEDLRTFLLKLKPRDVVVFSLHSIAEMMQVLGLEYDKLPGKELARITEISNKLKTISEQPDITQRQEEIEIFIEQLSAKRESPNIEYSRPAASVSSLAKKLIGAAFAALVPWSLFAGETVAVHPSSLSILYGLKDLIPVHPMLAITGGSIALILSIKMTFPYASFIAGVKSDKAQELFNAWYLEKIRKKLLRTIGATFILTAGTLFLISMNYSEQVPGYKQEVLFGTLLASFAVFSLALTTLALKWITNIALWLGDKIFGVASNSILIKAIGHTDPYIRVMAANLLAQRKNASAIKLLTEALSYNDNSLRMLAAETLLAMGQPAVDPNTIAKALIIKKCREHYDPSFINTRLIEEAAELLRKFGDFDVRLIKNGDPKDVLIPAVTHEVDEVDWANQGRSTVRTVVDVPERGKIVDAKVTSIRVYGPDALKKTVILRTVNGRVLDSAYESLNDRSDLFSSRSVIRKMLSDIYGNNFYLSLVSDEQLDLMAQYIRDKKVFTCEYIAPIVHKQEGPVSVNPWGATEYGMITVTDFEGKFNVIIEARAEHTQFTALQEPAGRSSEINNQPHFAISKSVGSDTVKRESPNVESGQQAATAATKICFIGVGSPNHYNEWNNLSLETLTGDLKGAFGSGVAISSLWTNKTEDIERIVKEAMAGEPDIIGISIQPGSMNNVEALVRKLNAEEAVRDGRTMIAFGNQIPTYVPEKVVELCPNGIVIRGEGELSLRALVRVAKGEAKLSEVPSAVYRDRASGEIVHTGIVSPKLDSLDYPPTTDTYEDIVKRGGNVQVQASRGCPWGGCAYCTRTSFRRGGIVKDKGPTASWEGFTVQRVLTILNNVMKRGITEVEFSDDEFIGGRNDDNIARIRAIADGMERLSAKYGIKFSFRMFTRPNIIYREGDPDGKNETMRQLLLRLKEVGLVKVFVGIEAGNEAQLRRYARGMRLSEATESVKIVRSMGLGLDSGFIMFDPWLTVDEMLENARYFRDNNLIVSNQWPFRPMAINHGSRMVERLRKEGMLGRENPNFMSYEYRFKDPAIEKIARIVDDISKKTRNVFYALKVKSKIFDPAKQTDKTRLCQKYIEVNGLIYLDLMEELGSAMKKGAPQEEIDAIARKADERAMELAKDVSDDVARGRIDDADGYLKKELAKIGVKDDVSGLLFYPSRDFVQGKPLDKGLIRTTRTAEDVRAILRAAKKDNVELSITGHLRGFDGAGSSLDLPEFQRALTAVGAADLRDMPSTPTIASEFAVKVRFEPAEDPDVVEYVAPDYGITEANPYRIKGEVPLTPAGRTPKGQKDGPAFIFRNIFGLKGVRVVCERISPMALAGGMESSNVFNVALIAAASMFSGANLSNAEIFALAVKLENDEFGGLTGGQGHLCTMLGGAYRHIWLSGVKDPSGRYVNPYAAFSIPLLTDDDLTAMEEHMMVGQAGKDYKEGVPQLGRTAALVNFMWTDLLRDDDEIGMPLHRKKLALADRYVRAIKAKDFAVMVDIMNRYVDIRDALCKRWTSLALDAHQGRPVPEYARTYADKMFNPTNPSYGDYETLRKMYAQHGEGLREISLYAPGPIAEMVKAGREAGIAVLPLGAGGPGANIIAISSKGREHIKSFFESHGLGLLTEDGVRKIVRGTGTLKGYMPFKVGRDPIRYEGFEKAGMALPSEADFAQYGQWSGKFVSGLFDGPKASYRFNVERFEKGSAGVLVRTFGGIEDKDYTFPVNGIIVRGPASGEAVAALEERAQASGIALEKIELKERGIVLIPSESGSNMAYPRMIEIFFDRKRDGKAVEVNRMSSGVWNEDLKGVVDIISKKELSDGDIMALIDAASNDHYWVRIIALSRLAGLQLDGRLDVRNPEHVELIAILSAYRGMKDSILTQAGQLAAAERSELMAYARSLGKDVSVEALREHWTAKVQEYIKVRSDLIPRNVEGAVIIDGKRYFPVARWARRFPVKRDDGRMAMHITKRHTQLAPYMLLWQLSYDIAKFREWFDAGRTYEDVVRRLIDADKLEELMAAAEKKLAGRKMKGTPGPGETAVSGRELGEMLVSISHSRYNQCEIVKMGAILADSDGNLLSAGFNSEPSAQDPDRLIMSTDLRQDAFMKNEQADPATDGFYAPDLFVASESRDIRDNRPDLRRSICGEQKAVLYATLSAEKAAKLNGSVCYTAYDTCNQCTEMLSNAVAGSAIIAHWKDPQTVRMLMERFGKTSAEVIGMIRNDRKIAFRGGIDPVAINFALTDKERIDDIEAYGIAMGDIDVGTLLRRFASGSASPAEEAVLFNQLFYRAKQRKTQPPAAVAPSPDGLKQESPDITGIKGHTFSDEYGESLFAQRMMMLRTGADKLLPIIGAASKELLINIIDSMPPEHMRQSAVSRIVKELAYAHILRGRYRSPENTAMTAQADVYNAWDAAHTEVITFGALTPEAVDKVRRAVRAADPAVNFESEWKYADDSGTGVMVFEVSVRKQGVNVALSAPQLKTLKDNLAGSGFAGVSCSNALAEDKKLFDAVSKMIRRIIESTPREIHIPSVTTNDVLFLNIRRVSSAAGYDAMIDETIITDRDTPRQREAKISRQSQKIETALANALMKIEPSTEVVEEIADIERAAVRDLKDNGTNILFSFTHNMKRYMWKLRKSGMVKEAGTVKAVITMVAREIRSYTDLATDAEVEEEIRRYKLIFDSVATTIRMNMEQAPNEMARRMWDTMLFLVGSELNTTEKDKDGKYIKMSVEDFVRSKRKKAYLKVKEVVRKWGEEAIKAADNIAMIKADRSLTPTEAVNKAKISDSVVDVYNQLSETLRMVHNSGYSLPTTTKYVEEEKVQARLALESVRETLARGILTTTEDFLLSQTDDFIKSAMPQLDTLIVPGGMTSTQLLAELAQAYIASHPDKDASAIRYATAIFANLMEGMHIQPYSKEEQRSTLYVADVMDQQHFMRLVKANPNIAGVGAPSGNSRSHWVIAGKDMLIPERDTGIIIIPGITELNGLKAGDMVIIDGRNGRLIVNPQKNAKVMEYYIGKVRRQSVLKRIYRDGARRPAATLDGRSVSVLADVPRTKPDAILSAAYGAEGDGLIRLEHKYVSSKEPTEQELTEEAVEAADAIDGPISYRMLDMQPDKLPDMMAIKQAVEDEKAKNGRLYEGVPFYFETEVGNRIFRRDMRALLVAYAKSRNKNIRILIPNVENELQAFQLKDLIDEIKREISSDEKLGISAAVLDGAPFFAMIESPEACISVEDILKTGLFRGVSFGTNDLSRRSFSASYDRDDPRLERIFHELFPPFLKNIDLAVGQIDRLNATLAPDRRFEVCACGEWANSRKFAFYIIGLMARYRNVNIVPVSSSYNIAELKEYIRNVDSGECLNAISDRDANGNLERLSEEVKDRIDLKYDVDGEVLKDIMRAQSVFASVPAPAGDGDAKTESPNISVRSSLIDRLISRWTLARQFPIGGKADYIVALGASVQKDGSVSAHSRAIVEECVRLYRSAVAPKVVFSGGYSQNGVSEAEAMRRLAVELCPEGEGSFIVDAAPDIRYGGTAAQVYTIGEAIARDRGSADLRGVSVVAVTQYLHSRRANATLEAALSPYGVSVAPAPADKSAYQPDATQPQLRFGEKPFFVWEVLNYIRFKAITTLGLERRPAAIYGSVARAMDEYLNHTVYDGVMVETSSGTLAGRDTTAYYMTVRKIADIAGSGIPVLLAGNEARSIKRKAIEFLAGSEADKAELIGTCRSTDDREALERFASNGTVAAIVGGYARYAIPAGYKVFSLDRLNGPSEDDLSKALAEDIRASGIGATAWVLDRLITTAGLRSLQQTAARRQPGAFVVLSGFSGTGKGTLYELLSEVYGERLKKIILHTTRARRPKETEGVDYYFETMEDFAKLPKDGIVYANTHGNMYWVAKKDIEDAMSDGNIAFVEVSFKIQKDLREAFPGHGSIFVLPTEGKTIGEVQKELKYRLELRHTDDEAGIAKRLATAVEELPAAPTYDRRVINSRWNLRSAIRELVEAISNVSPDVKAASPNVEIKKASSAPAAAVGPTQLFEIVEEACVNRKRRLSALANLIGSEIGASYRLPLDYYLKIVDSSGSTAGVKEDIGAILSAVDKVGEDVLSADAKAMVAELRSGIRSLEADSIVANAIAMARRAKREGQQLIIGLETSWVPGYDEKSSLEHGAMSPIVREIESLGDTLRSLGLDNVKVICENGDALAAALLEQAQKSRTRLANVVVLGSDATISSDSFADLRSTEAEQRAFLAAIDPTELAGYSAKKGAATQILNIELMKMLSIALDLAAGKEPPQMPIIVSYDSKMRKVIFLPKAEPMDYEKVRDMHMAEKAALSAA